MTNVTDKLKYTKSHEWFDADTGRMGITAFAVEHLGDVVEVEITEMGNTVSAGDEIGTIESVKTASAIYSPISGEITAINEELEDSPELVNDSPYNEGWLIVIKPSSTDELNSLMDNEKYQQHCSEEE
ncbi:MAG: glycine cleavage system protein GcvH [Deltaproteobacteria bacterium]|nr:glycine cleavage system protein GcvH [Deltaproteobacteria bacterium]